MRNIFQVQFGKMKEAMALAKEGEHLEPQADRTPPASPAATLCLAAGVSL